VDRHPFAGVVAAAGASIPLLGRVNAPDIFPLAGPLDSVALESTDRSDGTRGALIVAAGDHQGRCGAFGSIKSCVAIVVSSYREIAAGDYVEAE